MLALSTVESAQSQEPHLPKVWLQERRIPTRSTPRFTPDSDRCRPPVVVSTTRIIALTADRAPEIRETQATLMTIT